MIRQVGAVLLALAFLSPPALRSQEFRGAISGDVTDPTGAPVPGANVTVTETRTGTVNQAVSDGSGKYSALFLLPGDYDVSVQKPGFKDAARR